MPLSGGIPQSLTEKYQPRTLDCFVGLAKVRKQVECFVRAPRMTGGILFYGPPGMGKTSMAYALARAMDAEVHPISAQTCNLQALVDVRASCRYVPMMGYRNHAVLVEEADLMSPAAQNYLLSELDGTNATPQTKFIFTCNSLERFEPRFLQRCLKYDFSMHGESKNIAAHLERIWAAETGNAQPLPNFARIVKEANNSVRESLQTLEMEIMAL
jgi:replication-associated recombination protein RarA